MFLGCETPIHLYRIINNAGSGAALSFDLQLSVVDVIFVSSEEIVKIMRVCVGYVVRFDVAGAETPNEA
jgi:hypothetical protein